MFLKFINVVVCISILFLFLLLNSISFWNEFSWICFEMKFHEFISWLINNPNVVSTFLLSRMMLLWTFTNKSLYGLVFFVFFFCFSWVGNQALCWLWVYLRRKAKVKSLKTIIQWIFSIGKQSGDSPSFHLTEMENDLMESTSVFCHPFMSPQHLHYAWHILGNGSIIICSMNE